MLTLSFKWLSRTDRWMRLKHKSIQMRSNSQHVAFEPLEWRCTHIQLSINWLRLLDGSFLERKIYLRLTAIYLAKPWKTQKSKIFSLLKPNSRLQNLGLDWFSRGSSRGTHGNPWEPIGTHHLNRLRPCPSTPRPSAAGRPWECIGSRYGWKPLSCGLGPSPLVRSLVVIPLR